MNSHKIVIIVGRSFTDKRYFRKGNNEILTQIIIFSMLFCIHNLKEANQLQTSVNQVLNHVLTIHGLAIIRSSKGMFQSSSNPLFQTSCYISIWIFPTGSFPVVFKQILQWIQDIRHIYILADEAKEYYLSSLHKRLR